MCTSNLKFYVSVVYLSSYGNSTRSTRKGVSCAGVCLNTKMQSSLILVVTVQILRSDTNNLLLWPFCTVCKSVLQHEIVLRIHPAQSCSADGCARVCSNTRTLSGEGHFYTLKDKRMKHQIELFLHIQLKFDIT